MKKVFILFIILFMVIVVSGCKRGEVDQHYQIFQLAQEAGFTGTYEQWLDSIKGQDGLAGEDGSEIELRVTQTHVQWRYVNEDTWTNLIALDSIKGEDGFPGEDGLPGQDGSEIELQVTQTYVQWRYVNEDTWTNLIALESIKGEDGLAGEDGSEIEFQVSQTHIQWRKIGANLWIDLYALSDLKGTQGLSAFEIFIQYNPHFNGTEEDWLESLKGDTPYIGENNNWWIGDQDTGVSVGGQNEVGTEGLSYQLVVINGIVGYEVIDYQGTDVDVKIPKSVGNCSIAVISIADAVFKNNSEIKSVNIPSSMIRIGSFEGCTSLTTVTFEENSNIIEIPDRAFYNCSSLSKITLPDSITSIGEYAFYNCEKLNIMYIPGSVTTIKTNVFRNCSNLYSVYMTDSVAIIEVEAFRGAPYLTIYSEAEQAKEGFAENWNSNKPVYWNLKDDDFIDYNGYHCLLVDGKYRIMQFVYQFDGSIVYIPREINNISVTSLTPSAFMRIGISVKIVIPDSIITIPQHGFYHSQYTLFCEPDSRPNGWHYLFTHPSATLHWGNDWHYNDEGVPVVND